MLLFYYLPSESIDFPLAHSYSKFCWINFSSDTFWVPFVPVMDAAYLCTQHCSSTCPAIFLPTSCNPPQTHTYLMSVLYLSALLIALWCWDLELHKLVLLCQLVLAYILRIEDHGGRLKAGGGEEKSLFCLFVCCPRSGTSPIAATFHFLQHSQN